MIRCDVCHELEETDRSYFVSLYPSFTYSDGVLCDACIIRLQEMISSGRIPAPEFEDWVIASTARDGGLPDCGFFWSGYDEIIDFYCCKEERECTECGGIMIDHFFKDDDDEACQYDKDGLVMVYLCLNCGRWVYNEL